MKDEFLRQVREAYSAPDSKKIEQALKYAQLIHADDVRLSGEPWIEHCAGVAQIMADMHMDVDTICAALLHDCCDKSEQQQKQVLCEVGKEVYELVKGMGKVNGLSFGKSNFDESENLRRLIVAMGKDIRVVLIKLADRLDNMRSIEYLPKEKQIKYASETSDVFSPLAERLGLSKMHSELDDLCFKTLKPEEYNKLKAELDEKYDKWQERMKKINGVLEYVLKDCGVNGKITCRFKNFYSLYKKFRTKGTEKIYDIIAFRILVEDVADCYKVLGAVHQKYRPVAGRIKDYIASPKPNGYRSLHTTLITSDGTPFELQIRTYEMHETSEFGIAAHWNYKGGSTNAELLQEKLDWVKTLIESDMQITDSTNFVKAIQMDFSSAEIWVFTPKYKPISLPDGATPIDFAYAIHTELGHKAIGAKVNGKKASLGTRLETGDVVEIITSSQSKGPSRDWLNVAVSRNARYNIKLFFRRETTPENIAYGRKILEDECKRLQLDIGDILKDNIFLELKQKYFFESVDDMFAAVGYKGVTVNQILKPVISQHDQLQQSKAQGYVPVLVEGVPVSQYKLSHCCLPVPGDDIIAVSSKDGYSIHTTECRNLKQINNQRLLKAEWNAKQSRLYDVNMSVLCKDGEGALNQLLNGVYNCGLIFNGFNATMLGNGKFEVDILLKVKNKLQLDEFCEHLKKEVPIIEQISRKAIG